MSGVAVLAVLAVLALLAAAVLAVLLLLLRIPCVRMQVFFAYFFLVTTLANLTKSSSVHSWKRKIRFKKCVFSFSSASCKRCKHKS